MNLGLGRGIRRLCSAGLALMLGSAAFGQFDWTMRGIDYDTGDLYAINPEVTIGDFVQMDIVGSTGIRNIGSLEYRPSNGFMYGFTTGSNSRLYKINPETAATTLVGSLNIGFVFEGSLVIGTDGIAYGTNQGDAEEPKFFTVNLDTGAATIINQIGGLAHDINGTAWRSDGRIVGIDREENSVIVFNPANGFIVDRFAFAPTIGEVGGMCVQNDVIYFNTSGPDSAMPGSNSLYTLDLFSGATSLVGTMEMGFPSGTGCSGLAAVPEPGTLIALGVGALALAARRRRNKP
ncbi:MAG: DUF4394 domain-containing protein [Fimbriimonadaceae bacterium]|nr:DUF4394 domain-containing protein [Fimbriimonadaceae bacterium]